MGQLIKYSEELNTLTLIDIDNCSVTTRSWHKNKLPPILSMTLNLTATFINYRITFSSQELIVSDKIISKDPSFLKILSDLLKNKERVLSDSPLKIIDLLRKVSLKDTPILELDKIIMNGCRTVLVNIVQEDSL